MAQMSSQADTNILLAATVHGKGLKPSQPSSTPSSGQPPTLPDQRMAIASGPAGYYSVNSYSNHHIMDGLCVCLSLSSPSGAFCAAQTCPLPQCWPHAPRRCDPMPSPPIPTHPYN